VASSESTQDRELSLRVLLAEYGHLEAAVAMTWNLSMTRTTHFITVISAAAVVLALVSQATRFGSPFLEIALTVLAVALFFGLATFVRVVQANRDATVYAVGLNRIRHGLVELAPGAGPYIILSTHDDDAGVFSVFQGGPHAHWTRRTSIGQAIVTIPGVVGVLDAILAGALVGIGGYGAGIDPNLAVAGAVVAGVAALAAFLWYSARVLARLRVSLPAHFPTPVTGAD
jgi:hypothetical protein